MTMIQLVNIPVVSLERSGQAVAGVDKGRANPASIDRLERREQGTCAVRCRPADGDLQRCADMRRIIAGHVQSHDTTRGQPIGSDLWAGAKAGADTIVTCCRIGETSRIPK